MFYLSPSKTVLLGWVFFYEYCKYVLVNEHHLQRGIIMARKSYGVGYQGSKNRIAEKLMNVLPNGNRFVDLFSGGCAMTHCAMMSGKYNEYLCNDLYPHAQNLFQ